MGMDIEVIANVTYTVHLTDSDVEKIKKYLKDNEDDLFFDFGKEEIIDAVRDLYAYGEISLYDNDDKATESDFSTEEINWSDFEDRTPKQILGINKL